MKGLLPVIFRDGATTAMVLAVAEREREHLRLALLTGLPLFLLVGLLEQLERDGASRDQAVRQIKKMAVQGQIKTILERMGV